MEKEKKYVQHTAPDKVLLAKLLSICKGSERTMAQFGEDCQISPSTLSRILNCNITKPLSTDVLQSLFDNKAANADVTIEDLLRANGMVTLEEHNQSMNFAERRRKSIEREDKIQYILINELFERNFMLKAEIRRNYERSISIISNRTDEERGDLYFPYDFGVVIPDILDYPEWVFASIPTTVYDSIRSSSFDIEAKRAISTLISRYCNLFFVDAWQPYRLEKMKYSFVFMDEYIYDGFKDRLKIAKFNSAISVILIDIDNKRVVKEEWLNCPMRDKLISPFRYPGDSRPGTNFEFQPRVFNREDNYNNEEDNE